MRNLIYLSVFYNVKFLEYLKLFLTSMKIYGDLNEKTDIVILTQKEFENDIKKIALDINIKIIIHCLNLNTLIQSKYSRLTIFEWNLIDNYNKILYLDADIIISGNISQIFDINLEDELYVVREGNIESKYFGKDLFELRKSTINPKTPGFNSGVLLFKNCKIIKQLFSDILTDIKDYEKNNKQFGGCIDQPFFNYHTITKKLNNDKILEKFSINNPYAKTNHLICHFAGNYGNEIDKYTHMHKFLYNLNNYLNKN